MLEEKLSKRRKRRMEQLEKRHVEETKVRRHFEGYKALRATRHSTLRATSMPVSLSRIIYHSQVY